MSKPVVVVEDMSSQLTSLHSNISSPAGHMWMYCHVSFSSYPDLQGSDKAKVEITDGPEHRWMCHTQFTTRERLTVGEIESPRNFFLPPGNTSLHHHTNATSAMHKYQDGQIFNKAVYTLWNHSQKQQGSHTPCLIANIPTIKNIHFPQLQNYSNARICTGAP